MIHWAAGIAVLGFALNDFTKRHHWPVGVNGNMGSVAVKDGAGAVDDFLVALDFRHDPFLLGERRERNFECGEVRLGYFFKGSARCHQLHSWYQLRYGIGNVSGICLRNILDDDVLESLICGSRRFRYGNSANGRSRGYEYRTWRQ